MEQVAAVPTITRAEVLERAKRCIGHGTYKLGRGGFDPVTPWPWHSPVEMCDCSGFVAWCIGEPRHSTVIGGGWIETTAIVADANGPKDLFALVTGAAIAGDVIVYGDERIPQSASHYYYRQGHTGIISAVDASGSPFKVIHCSKGNFEAFNHAVAETAPNVFLRNKAIVIRPQKFTGVS